MWPFRKKQKVDEGLLERVWQHREEVLYRELFGQGSNTIYTLTPELFKSVFQQNELDPLWLHHGVMWYQSSQIWTAVTSGMTNPWYDDRARPDKPAGLGFELAMRCQRQEEWARAVLLRLMAYQLLIVAGRFPNTPWLDEYARVPLGGTLTPTSQLTHVMLVPRPELSSLQLDSGTFAILDIIPITEPELRLAQRSGGEVLARMLANANADKAIEPERASVT